MAGTILIACILAFLSGSIPFGAILARLRGVDIQKVGSGNIGATNVSRALGLKAGLLVLVLDAMKGAVPVLIVKSYFPNLTDSIGWVAFSAVIGHCFSPFLKGRGGKGVATGLGAFTVCSPYAVFIAVGMFLIVVAVSQYVALGSLLASLTYGIVLPLFFHAEPHLVFPVFGAILVIWIRHAGNIRRLFRKEEPKFSLSRRSS